MNLQHKGGPKPRPVMERLMEKISPEPNTGCWLWTGGTHRFGHGYILIGSRSNGTRECVGAHRVSFELFCGPIPNGLFVCHRCDVPQCVNPDHLFLGTAKDNMMDAAKKGRVGKNANDTCRFGHPISIVRGKLRLCRICARESSKKNYHERHKEKRKAARLSKRLTKVATRTDE